MKTLTLLRHAKSDWSDRVTRDFDRPLNGKGKRAAALIGQHLRSLSPDVGHVVASPAVRVVEDLVLWLVPAADGPLRDAVEDKYPTASIARMTFAVDAWADVAPGGATLEGFVRPRDLDPTLGPDED